MVKKSPRELSQCGLSRRESDIAKKTYADFQLYRSGKISQDEFFKRGSISNSKLKEITDEKLFRWSHYR